MPTKLTQEILAVAVEGYESQKARIDQKIAELRAMLDGGPSAPAATPEAPTSKRRKMSAAGRRAIAEAQRKRWAASRGESEAATPEPAKKKRRLSRAGRAAISAATKKRWALKRAEAAKATQKRRLSPARKAALVANLAKARAARAAKRAAKA